MSNKIYFTPGPAQLFYTFQEHLKIALFHDIPSISHRSAEFVNILKNTEEGLRELLEIPSDYDIYFLNSANEAWDRILQNLVRHSSHHFANGSFGKKFYDFAIMHGMNSTLNTSPDGEPFSNFEVPAEAELIGLTKNETSIGLSLPESEIQQIRNANPDKLIALDIVSAVPSMPIDFNNIDTAYFSVQKGFGMPPGLGVWMCNQRCQEKALEKSKETSIGSYRSLLNLKKFANKDQTPETPNTLFIYLLGKIVEDMIAVGKKKIINDTIYKSTILYQTIEDHPTLSAFVNDSQYQSRTTLVATTAEPSGFIDEFERRGMILGTGYGNHKHDHIRIANFPTHSKEMIENGVRLSKGNRITQQDFICFSP